MRALISIVVPVHEGMPYVRASIASALAQDYPELEVVAAVTGADGSREWLRGVRDERLRVIEGAAGAAANWTAATRAARGEFVKLLCQDDLLAEDAVSRQAADLDAHPGAAMAVAQRDIVDARGTTISRARGLQGIAPGEHPATELVRRTYDHGTNVLGEPLAVLFRRDALLQAMPWDDSAPLMLDVVTYERVADLGGTAVARREAVGAFRVSAASWSTRLAKVQLAQFREWQGRYEQRHPGIPERERAAAARAAVRQARVRRAAYAVLRLRGGLGAPA